MEQRKAQEAEFHDHLRHELPFQRWTAEAERSLEGEELWSNFKYYSVERKSRAHVERWVAARCADKRVLDFGCGSGEDSFFAAARGAYAVGIDLSPVSVSQCTEEAKNRGLESQTEFVVMDGESMIFPDDSFDLVTVYGVMHHVDFRKAMREISRVLRPDGQAIFTEALSHNPLIRSYRKRTPTLRTEWETEHILRRETIGQASDYFSGVKCRFYHLATLAAVPIRRTPLFGPVLKALEGVDSLILRIPGVKWQAWQVVMELSAPVKGVPKT